MKKMFLVLLIAISAISWQISLAQSFEPLTVADHKNYIINIDQKCMSRSTPAMASAYPHKIFSKVVVKLSDNSNDTLRYLTMSCSWGDNFRTDNKNFAIVSWPCDSNFPIDRTVPPHKNELFTMYIAYSKTLKIDNAGFKIGMMIIKYKRPFLDFLPYNKRVKYYATNTIWSNTVQIPK